jgi:glycerol kinase
MPNQVPIILAIDVGTTSVRCIAFSLDGQIIDSHSEHLLLEFPNKGWVETNATNMWLKTLICLKTTWYKLGSHQQHVLGIALANQRETTIAWDIKTREELYPAISWQDRRTVQRCDILKSKDTNNWFHHSTGLSFDPYFSCSKFEWLISHVSSVKRALHNKTLAISTVDSWIVFQLTQGNGYYTDPTNASRTGFFNLHTLQWDSELLSFWGCEKITLPNLICNDKVNINIQVEGLPNLPLLSIMGDQQAATYGHGCTKPGQAKNTYGTGSFLNYIVGSEPIFSNRGLITTVAYLKSDSTLFAVEGSVLIAGALVEWMIRHNWLNHPDQLESAYINPFTKSPKVFFVPAFTGLGIPYNNPNVSGLITGLTIDTLPSELISSALNSIAFQVDEVIQTFSDELNLTLTELNVDGGLAHLDCLMQFQADLSNVKLYKSDMVEVTAWGTARMGFEKYGYFSDNNSSKIDTKIFVPTNTETHRVSMRKKWRKAIECSLHWSQDFIVES